MSWLKPTLLVGLDAVLLVLVVTACAPLTALNAMDVTLIGAFGPPLRWLAPVLDDVADFVTAAPAVAGP
jgi:hypothetical protein